MDRDMLDVRPVMPGIGHKGRGVHDMISLETIEMRAAARARTLETARVS